MILSVKRDGKWFEFTVNPPDKEQRDICGYDFCCKDYMVESAVSNAGLQGHVLNHGLVGLMVKLDGHVLKLKRRGK